MYHAIYAANNKGAELTAWMHRLICVFVVRIWHNRFSHDVAHLFKEIDRLEHPKDVQFARSKDMNIVVTVAEDCNIRIWDRSRARTENTEATEEGKQRRIGNYYYMQQLE